MRFRECLKTLAQLDHTRHNLAYAVLSRNAIKEFKMKWNTFQPTNVEREVKRLFSVLGRVDKIPDKHGTYDFKIDAVKVLIEVTWISEEKNVQIYRELSDNEFYYKIRDKVEHVCKDHSNYPEYSYGGVISWDTRFDGRQVEGTHRNYTESFPLDYEINEYDWKYLVFLEEPRVPESDSPPTFIYLKEIRLLTLFQKVFENKLHVIYALSNGKFVEIKSHARAKCAK